MTDKDPFAGYTAAELRAAADAKDKAVEAQLQPWLDLLATILREAGFTDWADNCRKRPDDEDRHLAIILRDGAAKLLGVKP